MSFRPILLNGCKALQQHGTLPYAAQHGAAYQVRLTSVILRRDVPFDEGAKEQLKAAV